MPRSANTTGSYVTDSEIDLLHSRIDKLKALIGTSASATTTSAPTTTTVVQTFVIGSADGATSLTASSLVFDTADGFAVSLVGARTARVDRTATATVPSAVATAAAAGSATQAANADHVHALTLVAGTGIGVAGLTVSNSGVLSFNSATGAITGVNSVDGNTGAVFTDFEVRTTDPGSPRTGQKWYRSDTNQLCIYTGVAIKRSAAFT